MAVEGEGGGGGLLEEREATQLRQEKTYHWIDKLWCVFFLGKMFNLEWGRRG